jgi:hypothetical protein
MDSPPPAGPVMVNAKDFQEDLAWLAEAMVNQVYTEGVQRGGWSQFVSQDICVMLKYSLSIYRLLFYLNADVRRAEPEWRTDYGVTAMSLVRSLIDCLYNVTALLQNPAEAGPAYRRPTRSRCGRVRGHKLIPLLLRQLETLTPPKIAVVKRRKAS